MKTTYSPEMDEGLVKRLAEEFWSAINQHLSEEERVCPVIKECGDSRKDIMGYNILVCEQYPNACGLEPFKSERFAIEYRVDFEKNN